MVQLDIGVEDMEYYLQNVEGIDSSFLDESDDVIVKTINAFIQDTREFPVELQERNQLQETDIEYSDMDEEYEDERNKQVMANKHIGLIIFLLTVNILSRTEKAIKALCEIKNEVLPADIKCEWEYNDDNIQLISVFYRKLSVLLEYLEKETNSIDGKRNW